jgi:hypothetical protein
MNPIDDPVAERLLRLSTLTRAYARFSRSAGGLGTLLGGTFCLLAYFAGALLPLTPVSRTALALLPLLWIATKEWLRVSLYQAQGRVRETPDRTQYRWHVSLTAFLAIGSAFIFGMVLLHARTPFRPVMAIYLVFVLALPVLSWYYLWSIPEFVVGVFLICQAAVVAVGIHYPLGSQLQAPAMAIAAIVVGWREHREFLTLRRDLRALGVGA